MAISTKLAYESIENLQLDPMNPRLGRHRMSRSTDPEKLLGFMKSWKLDELAWSYIESGGFWAHEAILVVKEVLYGSECLVVVEGNRRLAALKYLHRAISGQPVSKKWGLMAEAKKIPLELFSEVPYFLADSRSDVKEFLGFRHVTGIKQWDADEKAGFIANLIDNYKMSYEEVMRKIGSTTPAVRRHYIAYRVVLQMEDVVEEFDAEEAGKRFAILYMTLNTAGAQRYLQLDVTASPEDAKRPIPRNRTQNLQNLYKWLYGNGTPSIVKDTRKVAEFGQILDSDDAVRYLESSENPRFDIAYRIAGGDEQQTILYVNEAANFIELALMQAHLFSRSDELQKAVRRLGKDTLRMLSAFPEIANELLRGAADD